MNGLDIIEKHQKRLKEEISALLDSFLIGCIEKSPSIYFRYRIGISYRKTTELLHELF